MSLISALVRLPDGQVKLYWEAHPETSIDSVKVAAFMRAVHAAVRAAGAEGLLVVWDNAPHHHGEAIRQMCRDLAGSIWLWALPSYSPDFNPDEAVWWALKRLPETLANFAARTLDELHAKVCASMTWLAAQPTRLANMLRTKAVDWTRLFDSS